MFADLLYEKSSAAYEKHVLLIEEDALEDKTEYCAYFAGKGFRIIRYENDLVYRVKHEEAVRAGDSKILMLASSGVYIPYDVQKCFRVFKVSLAKLFPKLNASVVKRTQELNYDLLCMAYKKNFSDLTAAEDTKEFLEEVVYGKSNIREYVKLLCKQLNTDVGEARTYKDWFAIAEQKAEIHVLSEQYRIPVDVEEANYSFVDFVLKGFGKLSVEMNLSAPVLVSRTMEYIADHSKKFVFIVMDGMSEFDWRIISKSFAGIHYEKGQSMAMIPTVTSISRQCLLSNKFPKELENPWSQSKEKKEFIECAKSLGFTEAQIGYERGYDADFGATIKCAAIIINDVDDMVHGQLQGRLGMYNDINVLADQHKLVDTVKRMLVQGFDVYISADHGNAPCTGVGKLMKTGVETETKSRRMIVLKDFANKDSLFEKYENLIEYPGYYLDKQFDYLICGVGESFDAKGDEVMSHGGITIDEVIVPFIKIKAVDNNG
ncbi:PglZ domain-containing protein [[Ruminococcus] lactaris]|uniref:PglZ domain-containing protein n=1 Tax=[Ruminococcus] lactaris TaxID=46228 RepID=UPI001D04224E|nr:PglZ domain-containing protein [[Ruminococcus] lactaris]MCB5442409.1 PglZ domain-containing protein [[Ruminococcus] lactaris]MCB5532591.1 PglZ domain-containing protein [[Ruminococcus] lactaris]